MKFKRVDQVVECRFCVGCGACASACPEHAIRLVDIRDQGLRPIITSEQCQKCGSCVKVCPSIEITHQSFNGRGQIIRELSQEWGPVLEVWEGFAADSDIRLRGSSGGAATALALYCVEKENFSGVLHIGASPKDPLQNVPVFTKGGEELLACTGSRYSPEAPCERLDWIADVPGPVVFIGKPCDVVALRKYENTHPELHGKIGLAISIFCAGNAHVGGDSQDSA